MRLIVLFSQNEYINEKYIKPNDILVGSKRYIQELELPNKIIFIETIVPYTKIFRDAANDAKQNFYQKNDLDSAQQLAINSAYTALYLHTIGNTFKYIKCIENVLFLFPDITEIVISDIINYSSYLPYYEAEGEINKKRFYKPYDFIPKIIEQYFEKDYTVKYFKIRSTILLKARIFARRYVLLGLKMSMHIFLQIKSAFSVSISKHEFDDIEYIFATRGVAHTHYFMPICKALKDKMLIHTSDSLGLSEQNTNYARKKLTSYRLVSQYENLSLGDYVKALKRVLSLISKKKNISTSLEIEGVKFSMQSVFVEIAIYLLEVFLHQISLQKLIAKIANRSEKISIITGEMLTPYPSYIHEISTKYANIRSLQIQTTLLMLHPFTQFAFCDAFVFKGYTEWEYFIKENGEHGKYQFWGGLIGDSSTEKRELKNVVFFTQPYQKEEEKDILVALIALSETLGFNLAIKFHPRENPNKYQSFERHFNVIPSGEQLEDYIFNYECAIIRISSIAHEIIQYNIPTVFCLFGEESRGVKGSYLSHDYFGTVFNKEKLQNVLEEYSELDIRFKAFRNEYLQENQLLGGKGFIENLSAFTEFTDKEK